MQVTGDDRRLAAAGHEHQDGRGQVALDHLDRVGDWIESAEEPYPRPLDAERPG